MHVRVRVASTWAQHMHNKHHNRTQVKAKRIRQGARFQTKSKEQIKYSFTPSSRFKGVSLLRPEAADQLPREG